MRSEACAQRVRDGHRRRVLLANAPNPDSETAAGDHAVFPAAGVVYLATGLRKDYPDLEIRVVDGGVSNFEEVRREVDAFKPQLLGLSVLTTTYGEGLRLAEHAKANYGSTVVLGNDHASFFPELIMQARPSVDYVVRAEVGENALSYIVGRELYGRNENLLQRGGEEAIYSRAGSGILKTSFPKVPLGSVYASDEDIPRLEFIADALRRAKDNYNAKYGHHHGSERTPCVVNNLRGCGNGVIRCTYCSIYDLSLNVGSPKFFWRVVDRLNGEYGINFFFEACDSFLTFQKYIRTLIHDMPFDPKDRDIEFEVYARANDVVNVKESIAWLKRLNVTRVNLGLDSGDDNMLRLLRKNNVDRRHVLSPSEINWRAVELISNAGMTSHLSWPLTPLAVTRGSLQKTVDFADRLAGAFGRSIATMEASELIPLPNSPSWDMLLSNQTSIFEFDGGMERTLADAGITLSESAKEELRYRYEGQDLLEYRSMAEDWIRNFTHVTGSDVEWAKESMAKIARRIGAVSGNAI